MCSLQNLYTLLLTICVIDNLVCINEQSTLQLKQVNVLFRHGDRTPDTLYPGFSYTEEDYFPTGVGGLTNSGKLRAFKLGEILRNKYNDFLGTTYIPKDIETLSSDFDRTKMSLQLVLAGLYPPNFQQKWKEDLNWQPIPIKFIHPVSKDDVFRRINTCKKYNDEKYRVRKLPEVAERVARFDDLIKNATIFTGKNLTDISHLQILYCNLVSLEEMGFKIPEWFHDLFPHGELFHAMKTSFELLSYNENLKRLNGGAFVRIILENMLAVKTDSAKINPKIYLYSGHDINIKALLSSLNLGETILSEFTSAVLIELLVMDENYYVKIWYYLGIPSEMKEMQIPNCPKLCPLDCFQNQTKNVIPSDEEFKCI